MFLLLSFEYSSAYTETPHITFSLCIRGCHLRACLCMGLEVYQIDKVGSLANLCQVRWSVHVMALHADLLLREGLRGAATVQLLLLKHHTAQQLPLLQSFNVHVRGHVNNIGHHTRFSTKTNVSRVNQFTEVRVHTTPAH